MTERGKEELAAPSELLRLLVENVQDYAVFVTTPDGDVESWNPGAQRLLGYEQDEILGQSIRIFFTPEDIARGVPEQEMQQAREAGGGNDDRWHVRKDGSRFWAGGMLTPLWDDAGKLRGFAKIMRDRTEWKLAQDRMVFQAELLDAVGQAVVATAPDGTILFWNRFAEKLYGWASSEAVGRNVLQILVPESESVSGAEIMSRLQAGLEWSGEFVLRRKDGTTFPVHVTDTPVFDDQGALHAIIGVSSDVTSRREAEDALRESEARFRGLIEQAPFSVQVLALDGRTRQVNRAWEELWGVSFEQIGPYNLLQDRQLEAKGILPQLRRAFAGEVVRIQDVQLDPDDHVSERSRPSDSLRRIALVAYPLKDDAGRVRDVVLVHEDVTPRMRAEDALRASEERFRQLADAMPQIVWTASPEGEINYSNRRWSEFAGARGEVGSAAWSEIVHREDAKAAHDLWATSVANGAPFEMQVRLFDQRRRSHRWYLVRTVAALDEAGTVARWFGTATDIHKQKQAEESARYLAEASAALSGVVDYESTLQRVANLAVPYFADWSAVDVANPDGTLRRLAVSHQDPEKVRLAHELMQDYPPDPQSPTGAFAVLRSGKPEIISEIPDELLVQGTKDARHLRLIRSLGLRSYICVPLIVSGNPLGVLTFATAESGRTYTEADLSLADDLARRAGVAIENTQLYQALREADRRKDEFLATLAHELRNPLAPIHSAVQLMRLSGISDPEMLETIGIVERQVTHIIRLVDDLMEVSRISRGKIEIRCEAIDLSEVVRNAVETSRPLIDARGHSVGVTAPLDPVSVTGDGIRLAQVVTNLLNNAAKFTPEGGRISVTIDAQDGEAAVRVRDDGSGIAPELLPRVFDLFAQGGDSRDSRGGLGIGLALVKQIVDLHGGRVEAHSDGQGRGSEFVVHLPALVGDSERRAGIVRGPGEDARRRVLVADDNVAAAQLLAKMLKALGHEVAVAHDGQEAVEIGEKFRPDIILMDLGMPRLDGVEAARQVRRRPWGAKILLVALTGWGQEEDRRRTKAAGFDGHVVKPLAIESLRSWLAAAPAAGRSDPN